MCGGPGTPNLAVLSVRGSVWFCVWGGGGLCACVQPCVRADVCVRAHVHVVREVGGVVCRSSWVTGFSKGLGSPRVPQVLGPGPVALLLLGIHRRMAGGKCPRHIAAALPPLKTLLSILGPEAAHPATFRYMSHMILPLLHVR